MPCKLREDSLAMCIIIVRNKNPLHGVILKSKKLDVLLLRIVSDTVSLTILSQGVGGGDVITSYLLLAC